MLVTTYPGMLIWAFVMFFGVTGAANLTGLAHAANSYASFHGDLGDARVIGALELIAASLLLLEPARLWGLAIGEFVLICGITILLYRSKYITALVGIPLMTLLPIVSMV